MGYNNVAGITGLSSFV